MNTFSLMVLNKKTLLVLQPLLSTKPSVRDFHLFLLYSLQKHFSMHLTLESHRYKKSIIFTDFLSSLQSISQYTTNHSITLHIRIKLHSLITHNYTVFQKILHPFYFCNNFVDPGPILIIFGSDAPEENYNKTYILFSTTPIFCTPTVPCNTSNKSD